MLVQYYYLFERFLTSEYHELVSNMLSEWQPQGHYNNAKRVTCHSARRKCNL